MKLRAISVIRDEIDILPLFLRHLDALFDEVVLLDHQSVDGSTELLKQAVEQRPAWAYYRIDSKQLFQEKLMNFFVEKFKTETFDYLFFLDADEFLLVKSRTELETLLSKNDEDANVFSFQWVNAIPRNLKLSKPLDESSVIYKSRAEGGMPKVAVSWKAIDREDFAISEGNHLAFHKNGEVYSSKKVGQMLHMPIRNKSQFVSKTLVRRCTMLVESNRPVGSSFQYSRFLDKLRQNNLSDGDIVKNLYYYQIGDGEIPIGWDQDFLNQCDQIRVHSVGIAISKGLKLKQPNKRVSIEEKIANALLDAKAVDPLDCQYSILGDTVRLDHMPLQ